MCCQGWNPGKEQLDGISTLDFILYQVFNNLAEHDHLS